MFRGPISAALCLGTAAVAAVPSAAVAQLYCSQPVQPYCTRAEEPALSVSESRVCGEQLTQFNTQMDRYQECLQRAVQQSEARQDRINERFRSRGAVGEAFPPHSS